MKFNYSKKIISLFLCIAIILSLGIVANAVEETATVNADAYPYFAGDNGGIFAHGNVGSDSKEAWQKWENFAGINAKTNVKYLFLPAISSDTQVELYNNYSESVFVNGTEIKPQTAEIVGYIEGEPITVTHGATEYTLEIYKSDTESSIYINDITNSYVNYNSNTVNTDFYSFLTENKENSVSGSGCAITGSKGIENTTLKKIKGRGNTNWIYSDKKPFNVTFKASTTIGSVTSKKFSLISNAKDSTLLRNKIMYDFADEVGSLYAPKSSFVDFYVNGIYRGCYLSTQKVDLGKNSMIALQDTSDTQDSDFNFTVEVDVWNYANDVYFKTNKKYVVVCKSPDLDGYNEGDQTMVPKYNYIKETYQKLEDALYNGTMADLENICDINSLATMYLLQDFGKNCDGGYTSTYFTYNAQEKKFYASPLWDCDSMLGAVDCVRDGCSTSTCDYRGWTTRLATFYRTVNPYGKAFTTSGKTSEGKTFEDVCKEIWQDKFVPAINILLNGGTTNMGKLKSINQYADSIGKSTYNNYIMWDFAWYCSNNNSGLTKRYPKNYSGEIQHLYDWTKARANWISDYYNSEIITTPTNPTSTEPEPEIDYFIQGDGFGGWIVKDKNYQLKDNGDGTYYIDITFKADTYYKFKIVDSNNTYYDPDLTDEVTLKYVHKEGIHNNAGCTPTEDTKVTITLKNDKFYVAFYELGDVNEDLSVNINDATEIQKYLVDSLNLSNRAKANADFNENGVVDIRDVTSIQKSLLQPE